MNARSFVRELCKESQELFSYIERSSHPSVMRSTQSVVELCWGPVLSTHTQRGLGDRMASKLTSVRRLLLITLLLAFFLPMFAPLVALGEGPEARLAMCCRKGGQHHCMSAVAMDGSALWTTPNRCPMCPRSVAPGHSERVGVLSAALIFGEVVAHPGVRRQAEARARIALDRARHKRGPPTEVVS